jgi:hypothetical protein
VFSLNAATLVIFLTVKDTKPTGSWVMPLLVGTTIASALIWLVIEKLKRDGERRVPQTDQAERPRNAEMNHLLRRIFYEHKGRQSVLEEATDAPQPRVGIRNHPGARSTSRGSHFGSALDVGIENLPGGQSHDEDSTFQ